MFNSPACGIKNSAANTIFGMRKPPRQLTAEEKEDAERLRHIWQMKRRQLQLSQESAAAECGWTQGMFWQYLNARRALNLGAVLKLSRVLQVRPDEISPRLTILLTDEAHHVSTAEPQAGYNKDLQEWMRLGKHCLKLGLTGTARCAVENIIEAVLVERGVAEGNVTAKKTPHHARRIQDHTLGTARKKVTR